MSDSTDLDRLIGPEREGRASSRVAAARTTGVATGERSQRGVRPVNSAAMSPARSAT